ncbi:YPDG domain-containing protein [Corynebacterium sp. MSK041]|uniref:Rib/alpha-like domain-containing protein n=1 Tax=Corynebacterium sp. MSK041 TaxID=3050194 RepID=UPI00254D83B8|nr:YPDG domain-containing protein [Corynebacterium sp. MSK041]MDK8795003.1 YPDG domain-containing protein [Corynebacterium sp. MSK041]
MRSAHRRITAIAVAMTVGLCVPSFTMHVGGPHGFGPAVAQAQQAEPRVVYIGDRVVLRPIDYTPTKQEWVVGGTVVKSCEFPNGFDASSCALRIDYPAGTRIDLVSYSPTHESTIPLVVKDPAAGFGFAGTQETTVSREVGETVALRVDEELPPAANTIVWRRGAQVVKKCQVASAADVAACSYTLGAEDEGKEVTVDLLYRNRAVSTLTINVGAVTPEPGEDEPEDATLADTHEPVYPPSFAHVGQGGSSHAPTFNVVHGGVTFNRQPTPEGTSFEVVSGTAVVDAEGKLTVLTPPGMQVGEKIPVTVKVTYADGSFDTVVVEFLLVGDLMAEKYSPAYEENRTAAKGKTITVHQVGEASMPEVEYFVVEPAEGFRGWLVGIDKNTGALRLTAPEEDATPLTVTVHAVYPDASVDELTATVRINPEGSDASQFLPSQPVPIIVAPGEAGSFTPQGLPSGTTFDSVSDGGLENLTVDRGTGQTDFTMPRDAVPDALYLPTMDVLYSDGSDNRIATPVHVSSLAQKARPKWGAITVRAGRSASAAQTGTVPAGTTFALPRSFTPEGWHVRIDATTGHLTVTTTRNATPENHITIPVIVTYSDGSHREVAVEAEMTGGGQGSSISDRLRLSTLDWVGLAMTLLVGILTTLAASQRALQLVEKINRQLQAR